MPILVLFHDNWADEFNVEGFNLYDSIDEWNEYLDNLREDYGDNSFTMPFGSNQEIDYENVDDYASSFKVIEITEAEHDFIVEKLLGGSKWKSFGHFLSW